MKSVFEKQKILQFFMQLIIKIKTQYGYSMYKKLLLYLNF